MNSRNTGVSGRSWRRLLEAAEKTVSRSFLCLWFVVSQSVTLVERLFFRGAECVVVWRGCVWLCMCACVRVGFDNNNMPALLAFFCNNNNNNNDNNNNNKESKSH